MATAIRLGLIASALVSSSVNAQTGVDPANPTCPANPNWSSYREMRLTVQEVAGRHVLVAEGTIDGNLIPRLQSALQDQRIEEVWLRSPGGEARTGNEAGRLIRASGVATRIPSGWACYSACNFMFMGGIPRTVDDGGLFIVQTDPPFDLSNVPASERQALTREITQVSALMAAEDNDFVTRMGVSRALLAEVMYAPAANGSRRRCLSREELERYNLDSRVVRPPE